MMLIVITRFLFICLLIVFVSSCKKETDPPGAASLTIVNALTGSTGLIPNFKNEGHLDYSKTGRIAYLHSREYAVEANNLPKRLRFFQIPDTTDKDGPLLDLQLNLPLSSIHTLLITGTVDAPESILIKEEEISFFPVGDSAMAIRFINLSTGSAPISVNIQGLSDGSEVTGLEYKSSTAFKRYPVSLSLQDYVFEFRDSATGDLLATYTTLGLQEIAPNNWVFKSFTLALTGKHGETGSLAPTAILIAHH